MSLGVGLRRVGQAWRIRDLDALPHKQAVKEYLESFGRAFPSATTAPTTPPATQPVGGEPVSQAEEHQASCSTAASAV